MKKTLWAIVAAAILVGGPCRASDKPKTFVAVTFNHGWYGEDDGLNGAGIMAGARVPYLGGDTWRLYVGVETYDIQPAKDEGVIVKRNQGGTGGVLAASIDIVWGPHSEKIGPILGLFGYVSGLDNLRFDPDADDDFSFGARWGAGPIVHLSRDWHVVLATSFHPTWDSFTGGNIDVGGALVMTKF